MFDELYPDARDASLAQSSQRHEQPNQPGTFQGIGGALADAVPHAALTSASAWQAVLDAYGKAAAYRDAPLQAAVEGRPAPDMDKLTRETLDKMGDSPEARALREKAKGYAPDPASVGLAGQIVHGVASTLAKAGAYAPTGPVAPALFGADLGIGRAQELTDQGVDGGTAALAGVVSWAAGAAGMRLPAAMGATRLQSTAIGAAVNPALTATELGGIHALLAHADYGKIAAQYDPLDPVALAVSAVTGGVFGAAFHAKPVGRPLSADEHAAVLTMHEVRAREADTLARSDTFTSADRAHEIQALARQQLDQGETVSVAAHIEADPAHVEAAFRRAADALIHERIDPAPMLANPVTSPSGVSLPNISPASAPTGVSSIVEAVREVVGRMMGENRAAPEPTTASPELTRAQSIAQRLPDLIIPTGEVDANGAPVVTRAADLLAHAREVEAQAKADSAAFQAAVNCALRFAT